MVDQVVKFRSANLHSPSTPRTAIFNPEGKYLALCHGKGPHSTRVYF